MGGLHLGDLLQGQTVTVLDHQHPGIDTVPQQLFHGSAHGRDPLAGSQHQQTPPARQFPALPVHQQLPVFQADMAHQGRIGSHGPHPGIEDRIQHGLAGFQFHHDLS